MNKNEVLVRVHSRVYLKWSIISWVIIGRAEFGRLPRPYLSADTGGAFGNCRRSVGGRSAVHSTPQRSAVTYAHVTEHNINWNMKNG